MRTTSIGLAVVFSFVTFGCGGSTDDASGSGASAGSGGTSGSGGASGGAGGSSAGGGAGGTSGSGGASGGAAGSGGTGGGSGGSAGAAQCTDASQCTLHSDCCTCQAVGPGEKVPECPVDCIIDMCASLGVTEADVACAAGSCVAGIQCASETICNSKPPVCEPGEVPSIKDQCWGPCVPATECAGVSGCADCTGPLQTCVTIETQTGDGPASHCVDIPKGCEGNPTCECMGDSVCPAPFDTCTDFSGVKGMLCSCPNC